MSTPVLEVAVYTANEPSTFSALQERAHDTLASFDGFVAGVALRGAESPATRADLIAWSSADTAAAAASAIQSDPRFAEFMTAIAEVRHFAHYAGVGPDTLRAVSRAPAVEVAVYGADGALADLQKGVHGALAKVDGVIASGRGRHEGDDGLVLLDLIGWRDPAASQAAPAQLQSAHPELAPFFSGMSDVKIFEMFEVVR